MIAPEEIALAFAQVVERAHSIENEELLVVVASSFGIQRVTSNIKTLLEKQLQKLIKSGALVLDGGLIIVPGQSS